MPQRWVNTTVASVDKNGHRMTSGSETIPSRLCKCKELLWSGRQKNDERYMVVGIQQKGNDVDHRSKGASTSTWSSRNSGGSSKDSNGDYEQVGY